MPPTDTHTATSAPTRRHIPHLVGWLCGLFALATAIYPVARSAFRVEINYNEGWNVYNADLVAHHQFLYPVKYGWTAVNYPMLSFAISAALHPLTHDFLFTARIITILSLLSLALCTALIVHRFSRSRSAALLTAFFTIAFFCTFAEPYIGMDDPHMLSQAVFMAGLTLYIYRRDNWRALALVALLFVTAGSVKQSPIDIPLAVILDLALLSYTRTEGFRRAAAVRCAGFTAWCLVLGVASVLLHLHFGGPYYFEGVMSRRDSHLGAMYHGTAHTMKPLAPILFAALAMAFTLRKDTSRRIVALLLFTGFLVGGYFSGAVGTSVNLFFTPILAMTMLLGLLYAGIESHAWRWTQHSAALCIPLFFFAWLVIPWSHTGHINIPRALHELREDEAAFTNEVALIQSHPGPVMCESLLRCFYASKTYDYDPFNATRLIGYGYLSPQPIIDRVQTHQYAIIEMAESAASAEQRHSSRFAPPIAHAIGESYALACVRKDVYIYVPRTQDAATR